MKKLKNREKFSRSKRSYLVSIRANADLVGSFCYCLVFLIAIWIAFSQLGGADEKRETLVFSYFVLCFLGFIGGLLAVVLSAIRCLFHFHSQRYWGFAFLALSILLLVQILVAGGSFFASVSVSFLLELFLAVFSVLALALSLLIEPVRTPRKKVS